MRLHHRGAWLRRYLPRIEPALRLVCLPHAGGAATFFAPWARALPPSVELVAVQYPGRQDRIAEPCIDDIEVLADHVADALVPDLDGPVAVFGHSMGAAVAYEVARRLALRPQRPLAALIVSGRPAPARDRGGSRHRDGDDALWAELRALGGTDRAVFEHPELRAVLMPALRADYRASETYQWRPGPRLRCPVIACVGDADPEVTADEALAWREVTDGDFDLRVFEGDHFYLLPRRAALISAILRRVDAPRPARQAWPSTP